MPPLPAAFSSADIIKGVPTPGTKPAGGDDKCCPPTLQKPLTIKKRV